MSKLVRFQRILRDAACGNVKKQVLGICSSCKMGYLCQRRRRASWPICLGHGRPQQACPRDGHPPYRENRHGGLCATGGVWHYSRVASTRSHLSDFHQRAGDAGQTARGGRCRCLSGQKISPHSRALDYGDVCQRVHDDALQPSPSEKSSCATSCDL